MIDINQEKKEALLEFLSHGIAMIHLDARMNGVLVLPHLKSARYLRLNLSWKFDPPDMKIDDWGVTCTLSFDGSGHPVRVPWASIFSISSEVTKGAKNYPHPPDVGAPAPSRAHLRLIKGGLS